jgi:hypothetical protein
MVYRSCCSGSRFVAMVIGKKACKSIDGFLLEGSVADLQSLHDRSHNCSPASGILPLFTLRLPVAELHQRCGQVRLLPRGRGMKLPGELRRVTLHSLHLNGGNRTGNPVQPMLEVRIFTLRDASLFKARSTGISSPAAAAAAAAVTRAAFRTIMCPSQHLDCCEDCDFV